MTLLWIVKPPEPSAEPDEEPVTTSSQLLLDDLAECVVALLSPSLSLQQISDAAEGLLRSRFLESMSRSYRRRR
jgi:hypothetical protein